MVLEYIDIQWEGIPQADQVEKYTPFVNHLHWFQYKRCMDIDYNQ